MSLLGLTCPGLRFWLQHMVDEQPSGLGELVRWASVSLSTSSFKFAVTLREVRCKAVVSKEKFWVWFEISQPWIPHLTSLVPAMTPCSCSLLKQKSGQGPSSATCPAGISHVPWTSAPVLLLISASCPEPGLKHHPPFPSWMPLWDYHIYSRTWSWCSLSSIALDATVILLVCITPEPSLL